MAVKFIGDVTWQQAEDELWSVDSYGADHCSVLYRGARTLMADYEKLLQGQRFGAMTGFPFMFLANWNNVQMTPNFPGIQLNFIGFRSGVIPALKVVDTKTTQSATGQGVDTASNRNVSGTFIYQAPRTVYTWWATTAPPKDSPYNTVSDGRDPLRNIIQYSIQDADTGHPIGTIPYSAFVAVFNKLVRRVFVSDYSRECLVPGRLWACSASVDYQVIT